MVLVIVLLSFQVYPTGKKMFKMSNNEIFLLSSSMLNYVILSNVSYSCSCFMKSLDVQVMFGLIHIHGEFIPAFDIMLLTLPRAYSSLTFQEMRNRRH